MKIVGYLTILLFLPLAHSCKSRPSSVTLPESIVHTIPLPEQRLLDSILQYALDHEALYTIMGNVKPMSSVGLYRFPLANRDSLKLTSADIVDRQRLGVHLDRLHTVQRVVKSLDFPDLKFVLVPYRSSQDSIRLLQLSVVRISSLDSLLRAEESFFAQFGLVPGADPAVVISTIENADRFERNRGYGYLFGYPPYAVDFFVEAMFEASKTKQHPPRKFFQIPVYARETGSFTYAYPEDYTPTLAVDSAIYYRSTHQLQEYKKIRNNYLNSDSTLRASQLLRDFYKQSPATSGI